MRHASFGWIVSSNLLYKYVRAEREGDWLLHVHCVKATMPYFFAAGHLNYARLGLVYLRAIKTLPENILLCEMSLMNVDSKLVTRKRQTLV